MVVRILTRFGCRRKPPNNQYMWLPPLRLPREKLTLISLCSKNWRMTFLRYSRFTSSSALDSFVGDTAPEGRSEFEEIDVRLSVPLASFDAQYPTPGFLCFSSSAAEDWTFRSSSRSV